VVRSFVQASRRSPSFTTEEVQVFVKQEIEAARF
jgi:hypothetical protein